MDLRSGQEFWPLVAGLRTLYPPLERDEAGEVVVIGGGITGSLAAHRLAESGRDVVVLDRRHVGWGSTLASTALIQYEIDVPLSRLGEMIGAERAARAYTLCAGAVDELGAVCRSLEDACGYERKSSLFLARSKRDLAWMREECELRRSIGLDVEFLNADDLQGRYDIRRPGAIISTCAAQVDPYRLTHALLKQTAGRGARVYDRTRATSIEGERGSMLVKTGRGGVVRAQHVVVAGGYEATSMLKEKIADLRSTYAVVSEPVASLRDDGALPLIWEAGDPYLYARTTPDGRLMYGGEDNSFHNASLRDRALPGKERRLTRRMTDLLPALEIEPAFAWAGTFGQTRDGLSYFGESPELPGVIFDLAFGGNGMSFATLFAGMLDDKISGRSNPHAALFAFGR